MALQLVPDSNLVFKGPFNVVSTTVLELFNSGNDRLAFKMHTTRPKCYSVRRNVGFVESRTSASIQIMLRPPGAGNLQDDRTKHQFMLQWVVVPSTYTGDAYSFWKQDVSNLIDVHDSRLKCIFIDEQPDNKETQSDPNRQILKSTIELDYLDSERVVGDSPGPELLCSICHNILWKPIACTVCENAFCVGCIRKLFSKVHSQCQQICPFRCTFKEKRAPPILNTLLSKLKIYCAYRNNGCQQLLNYDALEIHEQTCEYEGVPCSVCQMLLSQRDPINNEHDIRQCFMHIQGIQTGNQVQAQLMMLLNVIDEQNKRIKSLEDQLNNMSP